MKKTQSISWCAMGNELIKFCSSFRKAFRYYAPDWRWCAFDPEDGKDLLQEVIDQAWHSFPRFESKFKVFYWVYPMAFNKALTHTRKSAHPSLELLIDSADPLVISRRNTLAFDRLLQLLEK